MACIAMLVWNDFVNDARVLKEAQTLARGGHQVIIYALHTPGKTCVYEEIESGVCVVRVMRSPLWGLRTKIGFNVQVPNLAAQPKAKSLKPHRQILRLTARSLTHVVLCWKLLRSGADAIHAHDVNVLPTAWLAAKIIRVPLVYDAHEISTDREGYKSFRKCVGWIEKKIMPGVAASITTTTMRAKYFARSYRIQRPVVLQNRPRFSRIGNNNRIREELNLTKPWPIILYQGGLQQGRGLPLLVQAAKNVPDSYFVFIGSGRQQTELYAIRDQLDLKERVHFIPTVPLAELPVYTASADIGVQPIENTCLNHFTTDSNKLFEYVMAGLPVVASRLPEISKIVNDYNLGLLVTPGDIYELTDALTALVNDSSMRQLYAENSLKAAGELCWETQESNLIELYNKVIKQYE